LNPSLGQILRLFGYTAFLDVTIVNTALPFIQTALKATILVGKGLGSTSPLPTKWLVNSLERKRRFELTLFFLKLSSLNEEAIMNGISSERCLSAEQYQALISQALVKPEGEELENVVNALFQELIVKGQGCDAMNIQIHSLLENPSIPIRQLGIKVLDQLFERGETEYSNQILLEHAALNLESRDEKIQLVAFDLFKKLYDRGVSPIEVTKALMPVLQNPLFAPLSWPYRNLIPEEMVRLLRYMQESNASDPNKVKEAFSALSILLPKLTLPNHEHKKFRDSLLDSLWRLEFFREDSDYGWARVFGIVASLLRSEESNTLKNGYVFCQFLAEKMWTSQSDSRRLKLTDLATWTLKNPEKKALHKEAMQILRSILFGQYMREFRRSFCDYGCKKEEGYNQQICDIIADLMHTCPFNHLIEANFECLLKLLVLNEAGYSEAVTVLTRIVESPDIRLTSATFDLAFELCFKRQGYEITARLANRGFQSQEIELQQFAIQLFKRLMCKEDLSSGIFDLIEQSILQMQNSTIWDQFNVSIQGDLKKLLKNVPLARVNKNWFLGVSLEIDSDDE